MAENRSRWFASTDWLAEHQNDPDVVVIDGSWHLPNAGRNARSEYLDAHIPGAVFFDVDAISDTSNPLPHMLPSPDQFAAAMSALGIGDRQKIVIYDSVGLSSAPRVWWTLKTMGAERAVILEGGLPKWLAENRPVEGGDVIRPPGNFAVRFNRDAVRGLSEIRDGLAAHTLQVVDARSRGRFLGEAPEPRMGVKPGRMPGSANLPFGDLVNNGTLKDAASLREAFATAGVDLGKPIVTSCGSGVTAAILTLALETIGVDKSGLYDGSWSEWGGRDDTEIATGPLTDS